MMAEERNEAFEYMDIVRIEPMGRGTRVCVDFIDLLGAEEGILVGNTGHGFLKVMAETRPTATYPTREFRVNAGAVNQYLYLGGDETCYLSELKPGMTVPVYGTGGFRYVTVGRVKLEKREFRKVTVSCGNEEISAILQDSESVFLQEPEASYTNMKELRPGLRVLAMPSEPGRHLGGRIEEEIEER